MAPFSWVLVCTRFCLCPPRVSDSPVLWKFCNQVLLTFKVRFPGDSGDLNLRIPGDSQSLCWIPRLRSLLWGLEFSQQCENFFGVIALPFVDRPPGGSVCAVLSQSVVSDFATPWTAARQAPLAWGFSRQECWSGLSCPSSRGSSQPRD